MHRKQMVIGERYNWRGQPERLVYLGHNWSGDGFWYQFALVKKPDDVWCEVKESNLSSIEVSIQEIRLEPRRAIDRGLDGRSKLSSRQQRKARKAAKRAAQGEPKQ